MLYPDNSYEPYFWCLMSNTGKDWCNETAGWASTPEKAWEEAISFYKKYGTVGKKE